MYRMKSGSPLLYSEDGKDIVGYRDPDGDEHLFGDPTPSNTSRAFGVSNTVGGIRKFGHQSIGNSNSVGGSNGVAWQLKLQAEAPFRRVRLHIHNRNTTYPSGPWQASVGVTEDPALNSAAKFSQPIVGGVTYTALATSEATKYGYKPVTFGGRDRSGLVPPGSFSPEYRDRLAIPKPSATNYASFFNIVGTLTSDWIDVESVPAIGGGLPWALIRLQMIDGNANPFGGRYADVYNVQPNTDVSIDRRARAGFRDFQGVQVNPGAGVNYVTDPTQTFTPPADVQSWAAPNITIEFDYGVPTRNVLLVGDSVTEAYPWAELALSDLSTTAAPIGFINCGQSARQSYQFNLMLEAYVEAGVAPTDVFYPVYSVNDYNPATSINDFETQKIIGRALERIARINSLGAKAWIWTTYNGRAGHGFQTQKATLDKINAYFRAYAAANPSTCGLFDFEANWLDGLINANPAAYSKDGVHPNNQGINYMAGVVRANFK